jgi:hypothetical protein
MAIVIPAAASGSDNGGNIGSREMSDDRPGDCITLLRGELLACCIFIKEAGVAGPCRWEFIDEDLARSAGDGVADAGRCGGGIEESFSGSGEIESVEETGAFERGLSRISSLASSSAIVTESLDLRPRCCLTTGEFGILLLFDRAGLGRFRDIIAGVICC